MTDSAMVITKEEFLRLSKADRIVNAIRAVMNGYDNPKEQADEIRYILKREENT